MAFHRISSLPLTLRHSVLSEASCSARSRWTQRPAFKFRSSPFSTHGPPPPRQSIFNRKSLWLIPIAGFGALYLLPHPSPKSLLPSFFASPTLIPCSQHSKRDYQDEALISSPTEHQQSIISRLVELLRERIWEPIRTATRFIHLFALFAPVIIMTPMLLIGSPEKRLHGDRWGAVWWYGLLVARMEAAGPTFIKVFISLYLSV